MKPTINVLEEVNGVMRAITREMTDAEYAEYMELMSNATDDTETADLQTRVAALEAAAVNNA